MSRPYAKPFNEEIIKSFLKDRYSKLKKEVDQYSREFTSGPASMAFKSLNPAYEQDAKNNLTASSWSYILGQNGFDSEIIEKLLNDAQEIKTLAATAGEPDLTKRHEAEALGAGEGRAPGSSPCVTAATRIKGEDRSQNR